MTTFHLSVYQLIANSWIGFESYSGLDCQLENEQEFNEALELCENNHNMCGALKWSFIPIRTDNLSDLLFPTLIHGAIENKNRDFGNLDSINSRTETRLKLEHMFAVVVIIALIWDIPAPIERRPKQTDSKPLKSKKKSRSILT